MKTLILSALALSILAIASTAGSSSQIPHDQILAKCKCKDKGNNGKS